LGIGVRTLEGSRQPIVKLLKTPQHLSFPTVSIVPDSAAPLGAWIFGRGYRMKALKPHGLERPGSWLTVALAGPQ
jgi:hypothetical protein